MAQFAPWIVRPMGGIWQMRLSEQTIARNGNPSEKSRLLTVESPRGAIIESIYAKPIPPIGIVGIVFMHMKAPNLPNFSMVGSAVLPFASTPSPGNDSGQTPVKIDFLIETFFPPTLTTTPNKGLYLAGGTEIYLSLEAGRTPGWTIYANGGEL